MPGPRRPGFVSSAVPRIAAGPEPALFGRSGSGEPFSDVPGLAEEPVVVAHAGVLEIAAGRTVARHLSARPTPAQRAADISIRLTPFGPSGSVQYTLGGPRSAGLAVSGPAAFAGMLALIVIGAIKRRDTRWAAPRLLWVLIPAGLLWGGVALAAPDAGPVQRISRRAFMRGVSHEYEAGKIATRLRAQAAFELPAHALAAARELARRE